MAAEKDRSAKSHDQFMMRSLSDEDVESVARRVVALIGEKFVAERLPPPEAKPPAPQALKEEVPVRMTYTIKQLAAELSLSPVSIYRLEVRGLIKSVPGIRRKIYTRAEVERFLAGGRVKWSHS
jgi:helix-turn-helix protein